MKRFFMRLMRLIVGLFFCGLGVYLCIQANIGLAPWDAFHVGIAIHSGLTIGTACIICSAIIICFDYFIHQKIGIGTALNATLVGVFIDLFTYLDVVPTLHNTVEGIICLIIGLVLISFASILYIGAGFGCGPRDCLMVALCAKFPNQSVGVVRAGLEGCALIVGALLGAKIGIGTVIAVIGIGFVMPAIFRIGGFDLKAVKHEDFADTIKYLKAERNA